MPIGPSGPRFRNLPGYVSGGFANWATLTTALTGTNNDLTYKARKQGTAGNSIRITYIVSGASTPLSVAVSTNDINVTVATNGSSAATSTAAQIKAAIDANVSAARLVEVTNATGNDGTGVVTAMAQTPLAGGTNFTIGRR